MVPEIAQFQQWLRRRSPHSSTPIHYGSDLTLFFTWLSKPIDEVTPADIDTFIDHSRLEGHAITTINRRLAAVRSFYRFLILFNEDGPANPVIPRRHAIRQGQHLPRDVEDGVLAELFAVIDSLRDRAMFLLMLRCGLRVGEVRDLSMGDLYMEQNGCHLPRIWVRGKGDQERIAYLSNQMVTVLQAWLDARPLTDSEAVFLNRF